MKISIRLEPSDFESKSAFFDMTECDLSGKGDKKCKGTSIEERARGLKKNIASKKRRLEKDAQVLNAIMPDGYKALVQDYMMRRMPGVQIIVDKLPALKLGLIGTNKFRASVTPSGFKGNPAESWELPGFKSRKLTTDNIQAAIDKAEKM